LGFIEALNQSSGQVAGEFELWREYFEVLERPAGLQELFAIEEYVPFAAAVSPEVDLEKDGGAIALPMQVQRVEGILPPLKCSYYGCYSPIGQDAGNLRRVFRDDVYVLCDIVSL